MCDHLVVLNIDKYKGCFFFLPLLAWLGGLALECAGLPLLELGWSLLGCGGASGTTRGQGASCRGGAVHFC